MEDNSHAGQGAVLLDIGGTTGALVLTMPSTLVGQEIEIRPIGTHRNSHHDAHPHHPHVAVLNRPRDGAYGPPIATAVFPDLEHGDYELYVRPDGPIQLTVTVRGAHVSYATWPE